MEFYGSDNVHYITGRELGRGGEGVVYELQNNSDKVLKHYTEPLPPRQIQKLHKMVAMFTPQVAAYAAWPQALVRDNSGTVCGFVMKKLKGFVPLHMIFSPLDRKRLFPDKGYNFLVHVARNLTTAFHKLHEAGLVVGDVNEGNILINANGLVSFIDCDSFQVKGDDDYFYCEVGVPRYTPPELLQLQTFDRVVRTANTDNFSLAILIFQLLFMGRHPFAGRNTTKQDIDEETAIKMREFAYSLNKKTRKLSPPKDSFDITYLSGTLSDDLHRAFETDNRPTAADWVAALDEFLSMMVTCDVSIMHVYPSTTHECPWCHYRKSRGIIYFLDDTYLHASKQLNDIDSFVNGFDISSLALPEINGPQTLPFAASSGISEIWIKRRSNTLKILFGVLIVAIVLSIVVNFAILIVGIAAIVVTVVANPWQKKIDAETERLTNIYNDRIKLLSQATGKFNTFPERVNYNRELAQLGNEVAEYKALPEFARKKQEELEGELYKENLDHYLRQFELSAHAITSIGNTRKTALLSYGILTAADIDRLSSVKIPGIGPKNLQVLYDWRRQMEEGFVYIPDNDKLTAAALKVSEIVAVRKQQLEHIVKTRYQSIVYRKQTINNQVAIMEAQLFDLSKRASQAYQDIEAFKQFSRRMFLG